MHKPAQCHVFCLLSSLQDIKTKSLSLFSSLGICMAVNRLMGFRVVKSTRPVQFINAQFIPPRECRARRDANQKQKPHGYPDEDFNLNATQKYFFRNDRLGKDYAPLLVVKEYTEHKYHNTNPSYYDLLPAGVVAAPPHRASLLLYCCHRGRRTGDERKHSSRSRGSDNRPQPQELRRPHGDRRRRDVL